ncbi:OmpP1/FadL family transporter [Pollutimonas sp. M17]|uniref:OmpP1/FadL family transporter n=1 Tax=Pollutimonas sp. M17 TaxID=2962065 RepID=UPI0021F4B73C|nr:outer membrane protein transport protein [Pollutimonas sp. M17]UYO93687.1 outer membrane protein transport protein [Pollutimonas sp. M17]
MKAARSLPIVSAIVLSLGPDGAHAAGFQLLEQNASGIGNSYAGSAAIAENASTIFFNPAGMTRLPGVNVSAGAAAIRPSFRFSNLGSTGPTGTPSTGGDGGDAGSLGVAPNAYISWEASPDWHLGLGVGAPFGLMTEYDQGWTGRHHSEEFSVQSININPSVAYKVNDRLSIGAGVSWMQLDADYRRATAVVLPAFGYLGDIDTRVEMKGDAWGWNLGLLYQLSADTRLGLSYRSKVKIDADGTTRVRNRNVPAPASALIPATSVNASATVELADTAIFSIVHDLNSQWQLLADVSWTGWSSIRSLDIDSGALGTDSLDLRLRDTWRVALGANYKFNRQWTFKGGLAWDQSPVHDARYRPTSLPDGDRYWVSIGAQYNFNDRTSVDVGYAHLFMKNADIGNDTDPAKGTVRGHYKSNANIIGLQVSHRF